MGKINLSTVVASPVLTGKSDKYIWTGVVKSENIAPNIISDDSSREEFLKLVRDLERSTIRYRELYQMKSKNRNVLNVNTISEEEFYRKSNEIEAHILKIAKEIKEWLNAPKQHGIDIDLFWVQLCREYEEILENNPEEFKAMDKDSRRNLRLFKEALETRDPALREIYLDDENKYVCHQFCTRAQEKKYLKGKENNVNKLVKVIESVSGKKNPNLTDGMETLREISAGITLSDLVSLFPNRRFAEMQYITALKNYLLKKEYTSELIEEMSLEQLKNVALVYYNNDTIEFHSELMADTIISSIKYIDLEKLLLLSMTRPLEQFELMSTAGRNELEQQQESSEEKKEPDTLEDCITKEFSFNSVVEKTRRTEYVIKKILETGIVSPKSRFTIETGDNSREYSLQRLEELMKNYCDGIYLTDIIRLNLKYNAYVSKDEVSTWSDELLQRMDFSDEDKMAISAMNFENLQRLYRLGKLDKNDIKMMLSAIYLDEEEGILDNVSSDSDSRETLLKRNAKDLLKKLYNSGIVNEQEIAQYFEEGIITNRMLESLEEGKNEEELKAFYENMKKAFNEDILLRKYNEYVEKYIEFTTAQSKCPEDTEKIEELRNIVNELRKDKDAYREVFLKYHSDMTETEKHNLGDKLLEKYYIDMDITDESILQETTKILYEDGMIDLENIITLDKQYVIPMLDTLSLEDASKIRSSMSFSELEEMLDSIFSNDEFSDERKFIIVMNLLGEDTEEDKEAREFYLSLLDFDEGSERKATPTGNKKKTTGDGTKDSNKYIYPDFVKWKFYKGLDKDVRVTRYSNGFVEFASNKLGSRIIEKYYDGNKPAYGTATYVLTEQNYRDNQSNLITITPKGSILESATLREITPRKDRIAHRTQSTDKTWMDEIVKYFDIDYERENDTRYTQEELKNLQNIVNRYKKEYEMIK